MSTDAVLLNLTGKPIKMYSDNGVLMKEIANYGYVHMSTERIFKFGVNVLRAFVVGLDDYPPSQGIIVTEDVAEHLACHPREYQGMVFTEDTSSESEVLIAFGYPSGTRNLLLIKE